MSNIKIWFTVYDNGDYFVSSHSGVIDDDFDPKSLLFENMEYNDETDAWKTSYVPKVPSYVDDRIARLCDAKSLIPALQDAIQTPDYPIAPMTSGQSVCIKGVFDMDDINEYGFGRNIWD